MRHGVGAVGTLHVHALGEAAELPALYRRLSLAVNNKSRDARLGCQRFV